MKVAFLTDKTIDDTTKMYPKMAHVVDTLIGKPFVLLSVMGDRTVNSFSYLRGYDNIVFKPAYVLDKRIPVTERTTYLNYSHLLDNADMAVFFQNEKETPSDFFEGVKNAAKKKKVPIVVITL